MENIKKEVCEPATPYTVNAGKRSMYVKPTVQHNPYSIEELHQMIAEGEKQFASGQWQNSNEMFKEIEEALAQEKH